MSAQRLPPTELPPASGGAFEGHDHDLCISDALARAEAACTAAGVQLTPVRRRALQILLAEHRALGAYDVLARLAAEGFGSQPPVAYRALGFLVEHGLAHRIERLNAYVACAQPGAGHAPAFMICRKCHKVAEAEVPSGAWGQAAQAAGFTVEQTLIEAEGLCPACAAP